MYHPVTQEDLMGCGLACVASRAGKSYQDIKRQASRPEYATTKGYGCRTLVNELAKEGLPYRFRMVRGEQDPVLEQEGVIVFSQKGSFHPQGHWLLKTPKGWMDSNIAGVKDLSQAKSGYREEFPGIPEWALYPVNI